MFEAFIGLWNDLNAYYGKNITNPSVINEYEQVAKGVPKGKKQDLFSYIVRTYDYFPKLPEFERACARYKPEEKHREFASGCRYCLDTGLLPYNRKNKERLFAACVCDRGRSYKNRPILAVEDVFPTNTKSILEEYKKKNSGTRNIPELQKQVTESLSRMGTL